LLDSKHAKKDDVTETEFRGPAGRKLAAVAIEYDEYARLKKTFDVLSDAMAIYSAIKGLFVFRFHEIHIAEELFR
jgi:hypothetical protein